MDIKKINEMVFYRKHLPIRVRVQRQISEEVAKELEVNIKPVGADMELPWWKARILIDEELVKLADSENLDETYIQKRVWSEKSKTQLEELDKAFYLKIGYALNKLKKENKTSPSPILIQKIESLETPLNDLLSSRLGKLLKMAFRGAPSKTLESLTVEEKWLYENIHEIIKVWMDKILGD